MRHKPRLDSNQKDIVKELRQYPGVSAHSVASLGHGFPDVIVGFRGRNYLVEIKDPNKPPSARKLTDDEKAWHETWTGQVDVAETTEQIISLFG